ncbi:MAG: histidine kinase [Saprospiraceae bacterium]|nr:histidine kinase [Saprospiraceae bacterium]
MKKVYIYSFVLLCGIISLVSWELYKLNFRKDYHYYLSDWSYENAEPNDIGILVDSNYQITYLIVIGHTQNHQLCIRYGTDPKVIDPSNLVKKRFTKEGVEIHTSELWVSELYDNKNIWSQGLSIISQSKILELNEKNKSFFYKRLITRDYTPKNMIIISSRLITLLGMYIIIFLVNLSYEKLNINYSRLSNVIILSILAFAAVSLASLFGGSSSSFLFKILFVKNIFTFYGLWFVIKWTNKKWVKLDFWKRELVKIFIIAVFGLIVEYIGGHLTNYVFFNFTEGSKDIRFSIFSDILGWYPLWIYFALANFLANLTFYIFKLRKEEKEFITRQSEKLEVGTTIASIQSRINPHFLYNSLNSVASLARTEPLKTEQMVNELARFYKEYADKSSTATIPLREELEILKSYINIEKIRFGDRLDVRFSVQNEALEVEIPAFTLQPLVENAIKYGFNQNTEMIDIIIKITKTEFETKIIVMDYGVPFSEQMESGFGIASVRKKLKWLMPDQHELNFVNGAEKYVEIVLKSKKT